MSSGLSVSNHSDSTYHVPASEDDELDDSYDMYDADSSSHAACNKNDGRDQDLSEHVTDDEDDGSIEETYSNFQKNIKDSKLTISFLLGMCWSTVPLMRVKPKNDVLFR